MDSKTNSKPRKMKSYTKAWEKLADNEARNYCPEIRPCTDCGAPVIKGYCCWRCNSSNP